MRESRVKRRQENETKKYLFLTILLGIVVIAGLMFFGVPLLVKFSQLTSSGKDASLAANQQETTLLSPPDIDIPYEATKSATISFSGTATTGEKVKLYVNDEIDSEASIDSDHSFSFEDIKLREGTNKIEAIVIAKNNKRSKFSDPITVVYMKNPPKLDIVAPSDNQELHGSENNPAAVSGKTDEGTRVTVNGFWAIVDQNGNYRYNLPLREGDNTIHIIATDTAGNTTEKEIKVKFSP